MSEDRSIHEIRLEKLQQLRDLGLDPYATEKFQIDHSAKHLLDHFDTLADLSEDIPTEAKPRISFAGRLVSMRLMGKAAFAHLSDGEERIQVYFRKNELEEFNPNAWEAFKLLDIGDHVGITGPLFKTRTGEPSLHAYSLTPLSKALHNLPLGKEKDGEQWYGLTDVDQRYRHRHLDLITNKEAREMLLNRSRIVSEVRRFFDARGYLEVETPLLQLEAGGAAARPFLTHYNAYDLEVKLRISLELYLKRIICGDVPKVYEIGRVFRNEGVSNRHNPEFTLLEWYEAYANLEDMMTCVEDLFRHVAEKIFRTTKVPTPYRMSISQYEMLERTYLNSIAKDWQTVEDIPTRFKEVTKDKIEFRSAPTGWAIKPPRLFTVDDFLVQLRHDSVRDIWGDSRLRLFFDSSSWQMVASIEGEFPDPGLVHVNGISAPGIHVVPMLRREEAELEKTVELDFSKPWHRVDLMTAIHERSGIAPEELTNMDDARAAMKRVGLPTEKENNLGGIIEKLLEHFVEPHLQEPTFVVGYPIETSPLAKKDPNRPGFTRRFEGYVLGREICNAFSEINDPIDQRERFEQQLGERNKGDDEAHPMDEQFLYALESGMPPTGGCGIGIDRLVMLLTGAEHLREILLFPMMRPEIHHDHPED